MTGLKLTATAATLLLATSGFAEMTDKARYQKLWDKNVSPDVLKPKVACMCLDYGKLGTLVYVEKDEGTAICSVPLFDASGTLITVVACTQNVAILPK